MTDYEQVDFTGDLELARKQGQAEMSSALERAFSGESGAWPDWVYRLVAKLQAAEKMAEVMPNCIAVIESEGYEASDEIAALAAWESAGVDK